MVRHLKRHSLFTSLVVLLTLTAALLLCAPTAFAAESGDLAAGDLSLQAQASEVEFTKADVAKGKVTWDKKTNTVTLANATIDLDKQTEGYLYYALYIDGTDVYPTPTVTLKLVGTNTIKGNLDSLSSAVYVTNANLNVTGTGTLNIQCPGASLSEIYVEGALTMASGTVNITGGQTGFSSTGAFTLSGAKLSVKDARGYAVQGKKNVILKKGSLAVDSAQYGGVYSDADIALNGATVSIAHVDGTAIYAWQGATTMKSGKLTIDACESGIWCKKAFTMSGSKTSIAMNELTYYGIRCDTFTMKDGKLKVADCANGIGSSGTLAMSGGTLSITKASSYGVEAYGGKVKISGGSATVKTTKTDNYAIYSDKGISCKPACLKAIVGHLSDGATFKSGGNTYVVDKYSVTLKSYGASSTKPVVNTVKYGKVSYRVSTIGAKAFNTKKGRAIKSITLGSNIESIKANAFYGTSNLTKINAKNLSLYTIKLNKKAFAKCGKKNGAKLTITCKYDWQAERMKKLLVKGGLSKKATVK